MLAGKQPKVRESTRGCIIVGAFPGDYRFPQQKSASEVPLGMKLEHYSTITSTLITKLMWLCGERYKERKGVCRVCRLCREVKFQNTYRPCDLKARTAPPDAPSTTACRSTRNWFMPFYTLEAHKTAGLRNAIGIEQNRVLVYATAFFWLVRVRKQR